MSTLHLRLLLLPSSEAHARALAQLITTCHNHRLQRFRERNGSSVSHFVGREIQFCEGAVCLVILRIQKAPLPARERLHAIPSLKSGALPDSAYSHQRAKMQIIHVRQRAVFHAVPDPVVSREFLSYWALARHVNACDGNGEVGAQQ